MFFFYKDPIILNHGKHGKICENSSQRTQVQLCTYDSRVNIMIHTMMLNRKGKKWIYNKKSQAPQRHSLTQGTTHDQQRSSTGAVSIRLPATRDDQHEYTRNHQVQHRNTQKKKGSRLVLHQMFNSKKKLQTQDS